MHELVALEITRYVYHEVTFMSKKRMCGLTCIILIAGLMVTTMVIVGFNSREIVREVDVQNPNGATGTAFVVFRPGVTSFNEAIVNHFIQGLVDSDWRVEMTTTSQQTSTNVTGYDLIVLGAPVNGAQPHQSMQIYLARADFEGKPVVLLLTSGGEDATDSLDIFRNATIQANGVIHSELHYWLFESGAENKAYTAGTEIAP